MTTTTSPKTTTAIHLTSKKATLISGAFSALGRCLARLDRGPGLGNSTEFPPLSKTTLRIPAILAGGATIQDGESGDIPFEEVFYEVSSAGTYCLAVGNYSGTSPGWIQLRIRSPQQLEHYTSHHSIAEPADSANPGLLAVGAADILDTFTIEEFSGQGPTPDGRVKPDIVGADNVHSAAYGEPFYGTSQASPHVAGLAALVKQRFPDYTPQQVTNYLKSPRRSPRDQFPTTLGAMALPSWSPLTRQPRHPNQLLRLSRLRNQQPRQNRHLLSHLRKNPYLLPNQRLSRCRHLPQTIA